MIEHASWRDVYYVGVGYTALVVLLLTFIMEETIYDRHMNPVPPRHATGLKYRFDSLIGITGVRMAKYRPSLWAGVKSMFDVLWRPHALMMYIFVGWLFGCGIGINVTNAVFLGSPPPLGYGYEPIITASMYATPIVAVLLGEFAGRYINDGVSFVLRVAHCKERPMTDHSEIANRSRIASSSATRACSSPRCASGLSTSRCHSSSSACACSAGHTRRSRRLWPSSLAGEWPSTHAVSFSSASLVLLLTRMLPPGSAS